MYSRSRAENPVTGACLVMYRLSISLAYPVRGALISIRAVGRNPPRHRSGASGILFVRQRENSLFRLPRLPHPERSGAMVAPIASATALDPADNARRRSGDATQVWRWRVRDHHRRQACLLQEDERPVPNGPGDSRDLRLMSAYDCG